MPVAFFGASGRPDATIAALLLARGIGVPARLVRITLPDEPPLATSHSAVVIQQHAAQDAATAGRIAMEILENADERRLVLDLPLCLAWDSGVRTRLALPVIACGPMPLDETAALAAYGRATSVAGSDGVTMAPAWLLGCGRSGGGPVSRLLSLELKRAADEAGIPSPRCFPFVVPALGHFQAYWLENGILDERVGALALAMAEALEGVRADPTADPSAFGETALLADDRTPEERLRSLADDLDGIKTGLWPNAEILCEAPLLDEWSYEVRPRKVLVGTVGGGHPTVRSGRKIVTSEVFASDGRTWARTFGRTFRLGSKHC